MTKEALKLALEVLENIKNDPFKFDIKYDISKAITAIKEALAQPEQEPVAWRTFDGEGGYDYRTYEENEQYAQKWEQLNPKHKDWVEPLYTTPPQRKPLSEEEIGAILEDVNAYGTRLYTFARAIEAALKEKNT